MSKRVIEMFIFDTYIAILKIQETSSRYKNAQELLYDYNSWDSIIREFTIIGEATKYLIKENLIDNSHQIVVDFRNIIIHEYFGIDIDEVWNIIHDDLEDFKNAILLLIKSIKPDLKNRLISAYEQDNKHLKFIINNLEDLKCVVKKI